MCAPPYEPPRWSWDAATYTERADWVRQHIRWIGWQKTANLFMLSNQAMTDICQGGEWIDAYDAPPPSP